MDELLAGDPPNRGWNRASIVFWSRRPYKPTLTAKDLELPRGGGMRTLGGCALTGATLAFFCLWFPLFVAGLYTPVGGALYGGVIGGSALALTVVMYLDALRRDRAARL